MAEAEDHGWTFEKRRKYFFGKCHCGTHMKTVKMTPSDPNYGKNLRAWFKRQPCWEEGGRS